jgi:DNA-binding CsgD family transcriptional regulator
MDQVMKDSVRNDEELKPIASALVDGAIVVDASGQILWIDDNLRRRLNGGLQNLALPIPRSDRPAMDCFLTTADVMIDNKPRAVCVIQQTADPKETWQFVAAIEAIMADSSWLTRMIVQKFGALRQGTRSPPRSSDRDILTRREREVLWLICEGRSDSEMSERLNLSHNTVRNHIASLYRKIGVNRRSAAVIWAREHGVTRHDDASTGGGATKDLRQMTGGEGPY